MNNFVHTNLGNPMDHPRILKPTVPIHDKAFKYTHSYHTDLATTFARVRLALAQPPATGVPEAQEAPT